MSLIAPVTAPATFQAEEDRIRSTYAGRIGEPCYAESAAGRFLVQERERAVLGLLEGQGLLPLSGLRILEIGCGTGKWLRDLISWGADPESLHGIDLLPASVARARRLTPAAATVQCGSATELPYPESHFDLVIQATVFSSVLDQGMRQRIAAEMLRVLRPAGLVLWYDLAIPNPRNRNTRPVSKREIAELFPGCRCDVARVSLAPPIARCLASRSWFGCSLLSEIPLLRSHYIGALRKAGTTP
jgi:SAM-dependent methyltransferase